MLLGDLGADVIKIERPGLGDDTRHWGPPFTDEQEATYFLSVNRNKRSLAADMSDPAARDDLIELIRRADVLIENFRPGTMARHGLSYEQVQQINPRLVYCSITGFGAGKGAALPGYDLLVQAVGGLMSVTGPRPGEPVKAGVALVDVLTGLHAAIGVLAALRAREATGRGQLLQVNLLTTLLSSMVNQAVGYTAGGAVPGILGNRHPSIAPYQLFPTADRPVVVAVGNDRQFADFCAALGIPDAATDPRFATNPARVAHIDALDDAITAQMTRHPADHWFQELSARGVPCGPVNDLADAFALAADLGIGGRIPVGTDQDTVDLVANPIDLSDTPAVYDRRPPRLGEHTDELRGWLRNRSAPDSATTPGHHSAVTEDWSHP
jgi:crotonobetainyl-CoA:carnitine CoA-transferase CaiB-like acyl-CoA transferase